MAIRERIELAADVLRTTFGYPDFKPGQRDIVTAILQGRDVLGVLPTGAGKSICYQIPALMFPSCTLVVSPLVALMTDQVQRLHGVGVPAACLHGGLPSSDTNSILYNASLGKLKMLYVAPERLEREQFRNALSSVSLSLLVIDEAHCISEWGHDFRPAYRSVARLFDQRARLPIAALTATATLDVRADIVGSLELRDPAIIVRGFDRPNLSLRVEHTPHKVEYITRLIKESAAQSPMLIYAGSRRRVDTLSQELVKRKISARGYHAGKPSAERSAIQNDFVHGNLGVLVATNAFGMGIDKANIRHVVHTDLTLTLEQYYQEAGRAGRDGLPATCTLLYMPEDKRLMDFFIECTYPEEGQINAVLAYLFTRMQGGAANSTILADAASIAADLHAPVARIKGVLSVLEREGVLCLTNPTGSSTVSLGTYHSRLQEFADRQPESRRVASQAIARILQTEAPVTFNVAAFIRKHGITPYEFRQAIRTMVVQQLIRFRDPEQGGGIVLLAEDSNGSATGYLSMEQIHIRRDHAKSKLATMISYANATGCKRNFIMAYFADPEVQGTCKRCSSCSSSRSVNPPTVNTEHHVLVVQCIYELQGRFGKNVVADVLTATVSKRVVDYRLDRSAMWGRLRSVERAYVMRIIDEAVDMGFAVRSASGFPTLAVTTVGSKAAQPLPNRLSLSASAILAVDPGVYGAIVELRDQLASRERVAPTSILTLQAIERLALDKPTSLAMLEPGRHGGGLFIARHGAELVEAIQRATRAAIKAIPKVRATPELQRIVSVVERSSTLADVARAVRCTPAYAAQQIQQAVEAGLDVEIHRILPDTLLSAVTDFMRSHRYAKLRHVREHIGADVELPELRVAMAAARRNLYGVDV